MKMYEAVGLNNLDLKDGRKEDHVRSDQVSGLFRDDGLSHFFKDFKNLYGKHFFNYLQVRNNVLITQVTPQTTSVISQTSFPGP